VQVVLIVSVMNAPFRHVGGACGRDNSGTNYQ